MAVIRGRIVTPGQLIEQGFVELSGPRVVGAGTGPGPDGDVVVDLDGCTVTPGFVDVHVHGGDGAQAAGDDPDAVAADVARMARFHARHGTTCLLAATVADTPERLLATVAGIGRAARHPDPGGAAVAGVHLEGPWLAPSRCGAHAPECLRAPDAGELEALVRASGRTLRVVTIAPELDGAQAVIAAAAAVGITVSVGHTEAGWDAATAAFDAGARHVTHAGNAMPVLDRREPGPLGAALVDERVSVEVVADGAHLHPGFLRLVAAGAGDRLVAVTDAIAAAGLPDGEHLLGRLTVSVAGGRVVLRDRPATLAGSVLTMDRAVATLAAAGVALPAAVRAATAAPARIVGPDPGGRPRGALAAGHAADVAVLDADLRAVATVVGGRVVHDPAGLLAGLPGQRA